MLSEDNYYDILTYINLSNFSALIISNLKWSKKIFNRIKKIRKKELGL